MMLFLVERLCDDVDYKVERVFLKKELADEFIKNNSQSYKEDLSVSKYDVNDEVVAFNLKVGTKVYVVMQIDDDNHCKNIFKVFLTARKADSFVKMYNAYEEKPKFRYICYVVTKQVHRFATVDCVYTPSPFNCEIVAMDFDSSHYDNIRWDGRTLYVMITQLTIAGTIGKDGNITDGAKKIYQDVCENIVQIVSEFKYGSGWKDERINKWLQDNKQRFLHKNE